MRKKLALALILTGIYSYAQNDLDVMRYSRAGIGGSSRFMSMGGAFGAVGADLSCAAYNPAGLGLFRKGDLSFSGSLRFTNNSASLYNKSTSIDGANGAFNNFGIAAAWNAATDPDSRHVLAFTVTQLQNFNSSVSMTGYTNSNSLGKDMLNLANQDGSVNALQYNYEKLGFDTYLLDTIGNKFFSFEDPKRTIKQTRQIVTTGRMNDLNFSYAHSYKDKYYLGFSIGVPQINYESTATHTESDDRDSMRVGAAGNSYTTTYVDGLPNAYPDKLGFNSLTYTEYFKTTGSGVNFKVGGIGRVNDALRLGISYHTPTFYNLTDTYYNSLSVAFDANPLKPSTEQYPNNGGYFNYKMVTPSVLGLSAAILVKKLAVIGIDYEMVNYKTAQLKSTDATVSFSDVNDFIRSHYSIGHNVKVGAEVNTKPVMFRAGYAMQGSPFGDVFAGNYVRQTVSLGVGIRTKSNLYFDLTWAKTFSKEVYYLFTTLDAAAKVSYNITMISATIGVKF